MPPGQPERQPGTRVLVAGVPVLRDRPRAHHGWQQPGRRTRLAFGRMPGAVASPKIPSADDVRLDASLDLEQSCGLEAGVELENDDRGGVHRRRQSIQCEEAELGHLFRVDRYFA